MGDTQTTTTTSTKAPETTTTTTEKPETTTTTTVVDQADKKGEVMVDETATADQVSAKTADEDNATNEENIESAKRDALRNHDAEVKHNDDHANL